MPLVRVSWEILQREDSATGHRRQNVSASPVGRQSPVNSATGRPSPTSSLLPGGVAMSKKDGNGSSSGPSSVGHHGTGSGSSPSCAAASGVGRPTPCVSGDTTHQESRGPIMVSAEKVGDTADRRPHCPSDGAGERVCVESVVKRRSSRIRPRSAVARVEGSPQHTTDVSIVRDARKAITIHVVLSAEPKCGKDAWLVNLKRLKRFRSWSRVIGLSDDHVPVRKSRCAPALA